MIELAKGKAATVIWHKQDKYGRLVGKVSIEGIDVGLDQLRTGMAWVYVEYFNEVAPADRSDYRDAEAAARSARLGLWRDGEGAMPPWQWRKAMKEAQKAAMPTYEDGGQ
jgi:endonuclease YncB( thermonuclease family)